MRNFPRSRERAFSLLEILIALTILAIALGSVIQLFYLASRSTTFDRNRNEALSNLKVLGSILESSQLIQPTVNPPYYADPNGIVTGDGVFVPLNAPPFDDVDFINPDRFERSISVIPIPGFEGYLLEVRITLRWRDQQTFHYSSLTVCVSRI